MIGRRGMIKPSEQPRVQRDIDPHRSARDLDGNKHRRHGLASLVGKSLRERTIERFRFRRRLARLNHGLNVPG